MLQDIMYCKEVTLNFNIIVAIFVNSLLLYEADTELVADESSNQLTNKRIFVDLKQIGYEGTWDDFCSTHKIDLDFPDNPSHELRGCRALICLLKSQDKITVANIHVFVVYKFMSQVRSVIEDLSERLMDRFSYKQTDLPGQLLHFPDHVKEREDQKCHETVMTVFKSVCLDEENPYYELFNPFFARICGSGTISPRDMITHIVDECRDKAKLLEWNYDKILSTIHYQEIS